MFLLEPMCQRNVFIFMLCMLMNSKDLFDFNLISPYTLTVGHFPMHSPLRTLLCCVVSLPHRQFFADVVHYLKNVATFSFGAESWVLSDIPANSPCGSGPNAECCDQGSWWGLPECPCSVLCVLQWVQLIFVGLISGLVSHNSAPQLCHTASEHRIGQPMFYFMCVNSKMI